MSSTATPSLELLSPESSSQVPPALTPPNRKRKSNRHKSSNVELSEQEQATDSFTPDAAVEESQEPSPVVDNKNPTKKRRRRNSPNQDAAVDLQPDDAIKPISSESVTKQESPISVSKFESLPSQFAQAMVRSPFAS
jgi:hypothetical protein